MEKKSIYTNFSSTNFWGKNDSQNNRMPEPCPSCPAFQLSTMTTACAVVSLNFPRGRGFDGMSEEMHYRRDSQRKRPQSLVKMQMSESNSAHRLLTNCMPLKILQVLCVAHFRVGNTLSAARCVTFLQSSPYVVIRIHKTAVLLKAFFKSHY